MRIVFLTCISLASASLVSAQTDANSITVVASRNASLQADQAVFGVSVTSGLDASLEDVFGALQGSGITIANFTGVSSPPGLVFVVGIPPIQPTLTPSLQWSFTLAVPLSKIKD